MRRSHWLIAAGVLAAAQVALAQGEPAAEVPPAEAPKAAAAPVAAPPKAAAPAAEEAEAPAEAKPTAPAPAKAEKASADPAVVPAAAKKPTVPAPEPAKAETKPATATSPSLDVRPAAATTKRAKQPEAAPSEKLPAAPSAPTAREPKQTREQQEKAVEDFVKALDEKARPLQGTVDTELPGPTTPEGIVEATARDFFLAVMNGDAKTISLNAATPFVLENQRITDHEELFQQWLKHLRTKRTDLLVLYGIEVLSSADMEKKYGRPPARLAALPWRSSKTYVAIGNLSGHAAIALFREVRPNEYYLIGYTD